MYNILYSLNGIETLISKYLISKMLLYPKYRKCFSYNLCFMKKRHSIKFSEKSVKINYSENYSKRTENQPNL